MRPGMVEHLNVGFDDGDQIEICRLRIQWHSQRWLAMACSFFLLSSLFLKKREREKKRGDLVVI